MVGTITTPGTTATIERAQPAPELAPAAPVSTGAPIVPLDAPADADPCTSCGREELLRAYVERAGEQRAMDAEVLAQVAATYAASRPA